MSLSALTFHLPCVPLKVVRSPLLSLGTDTTPLSAMMCGPLPKNGVRLSFMMQRLIPRTETLDMEMRLMSMFLTLRPPSRSLMPTRMTNESFKLFL